MLQDWYRKALIWTRSRGDRPPTTDTTSYRKHPENFWEEWAQTFKASPTQQKIYPQHQWLLTKLEHLHPTSILEIGCGFGRNIAWLSQQLSYTPEFIGVDFSPTFIEQAKYHLRGIPNVRLYTAALADRPTDITAEVVLVHGVFMHIPPAQVQSNFLSLCKRAHHAILQIEEISAQPPLEQSINAYTYSHDYKQLYTLASDWQIKEYRLGPHHLQWIHAERIPT